MKSGRSGALKPGELDLSGEAYKCSDTGAGDFSVPTTNEISPIWLNPPPVNAATRQRLSHIYDLC